MKQRLFGSRSLVALSVMALTCVGVTVGTTGTAFAASAITAPTSPYTATYDATDVPNAITGTLPLTAVTVTGTGFPDSTPIYIEQCDGVSPTSPSWDPSQDCDLGSSPAAVTSSTSGAVTFSATDVGHRFQPFEDESPEGIFNCLGSAQAAPANGLPSYTNCQIRVSSDDSALTTDQAFVTLTLPNPSAPAAPTAVKAVSGSTTTGTGSLTVSFTHGSIHGTQITNNTATCSTTGGVTKTGTHATSPITVSGVTTGKSYTCKVTSTNAKGTSPASTASPAVIEGSPAAPTAVKAKTGSTTTTTGTLTVTFTAGGTNGSALTTPKYTAACTSSNGGAAKTVVGTATSISVTGATTGKTYTCTVKEHNAHGTGLTSAASLAVIVGSPAPTGTPTVANTSPGVLRVTFTLLTTAQDNGSALTTPKYTATCTSATGSLTKTATGTTSPLNVTGLADGIQTYTCTVKAHNARGTGLASTPWAAHTA